MSRHRSPPVRISRARIHRQKPPVSPLSLLGKHEAAGFTIVEIMVALTLGAILIGGVITIFSTVHQNYRVNTATARLQETGTFATELLLGDIRLAGFFGCVDSLASVKGLDDQEPTDLWYVGNEDDGAFGVVIEGIDDVPDGSNGQFLPSTAQLGPYNEAGSGTVLKMLPGSDAITVRYLALRNNNLEIMTHSGDSVTVRADPDEAGFRVGALIGLSDCGRTQIAQIKTVGAVLDGNVPLTLEDTVAPEFKRYGTNERRPVAGLLEAVRYFVACASSCTESATHEPVPTLYRVMVDVKSNKPAESEAEPLFRGVENIDLWYGIDALPGDGVIDEFVLATDVGTDWNAWHQVVAVRLRLTARTIEKLPVDGSTTSTSSFSYKKREFTGAVAIRNL